MDRRHFLASLGALGVERLARGGGLARAEESGHVGTARITFFVTNDEARAVAEDAWMDAQLMAAQSLYAPIGVDLAVAAKRPLPTAATRLVTRADRDTFAPSIERGVVNVFVVASLKDVDEEDRFRQGAH